VSSLYETDIVAWAEQQALALRRRAANELDWDNVAEEIEDFAARQKREVRRRLRVICAHLLKWDHLIRTEPRNARPLAGWRRTLVEQRRQLADLLEDSPSLSEVARDALPRQFANARQDTEATMGPLGLPDGTCPWSLEEVLRRDFYPEA
jgi:Domain of unknown function DUF29